MQQAAEERAKEVWILFKDHVRTVTKNPGLIVEDLSPDEIEKYSRQFDVSGLGTTSTTESIKRYLKRFLKKSSGYIDRFSILRVTYWRNFHAEARANELEKKRREEGIVPLKKFDRRKVGIEARGRRNVKGKE